MGSSSVHNNVAETAAGVAAFGMSAVIIESSSVHSNTAVIGRGLWAVGNVSVSPSLAAAASTAMLRACLVGVWLLGTAQLLSSMGPVECLPMWPTGLVVG
jgi:hypothetical protein